MNLIPQIPRGTFGFNEQGRPLTDAEISVATKNTVKMAFVLNFAAAFAVLAGAGSLPTWLHAHGQTEPALVAMALSLVMATLGMLIRRNSMLPTDLLLPISLKSAEEAERLVGGRVAVKEFVAKIVAVRALREGDYYAIAHYDLAVKAGHPDDAWLPFSPETIAKIAEYKRQQEITAIERLHALKLAA